MKLVFEWTSPALNTDGTTIPAEGLGSLICTRVEFGKLTESGIGMVLDERLLAAAEHRAEFQSDGAGRYYARGYAVNTYGQESPETPALFKDVP